jgi:hypothetical protein
MTLAPCRWPGCVIVVIRSDRSRTALHWRNKLCDDERQLRLVHQSRGFRHGKPLPEALFHLGIGVRQPIDPHPVDRDRAGHRGRLLKAFLVAEAPDAKRVRHTFGPRLFPGLLRRSRLGGKPGDRPAFRNDPAPGFPAGDQQNLDTVKTMAPAQCAVLQFRSAFVSPQRRYLVLPAHCHTHLAVRFPDLATARYPRLQIWHEKGSIHSRFS